MPKRIKVLLTLIVMMGLLNTSGAMLMLTHPVVYPLPIVLGSSVGLAYILAAYVLFLRKKEAGWFVSIIFGVSCIIMLVSDWFQFWGPASHGGRFSEHQREFYFGKTSATIVAVFVVPIIVLRLLGSSRSKAWLNGTRETAIDSRHL